MNRQTDRQEIRKIKKWDLERLTVGDKMRKSTTEKDESEKERQKQREGKKTRTKRDRFCYINDQIEKNSENDVVFNKFCLGKKITALSTSTKCKT